MHLNVGPSSSLITHERGRNNIFAITNLKQHSYKFASSNQNRTHAHLLSLLIRFILSLPLSLSLSLRDFSTTISHMHRNLRRPSFPAQKTIEISMDDLSMESAANSGIDKADGHLQSAKVDEQISRFQDEVAKIREDFEMELSALRNVTFSSLSSSSSDSGKIFSRDGPKICSWI